MTLTQRNYFKPGDRVEVLEPKSQPVELTVEKILSLEGEELDAARHPMQKIQIPCSRTFAPGLHCPQRQGVGPVKRFEYKMVDLSPTWSLDPGKKNAKYLERLAQAGREGWC